jgi:hypothetical protein
MDFNDIGDTPVRIHPDECVSPLRDALIARMLNIPDSLMTEA